MRAFVLLTVSVAACSSGGGYFPPKGDMAAPPGSDLAMHGDMAVPPGSDLSMPPGSDLSMPPGDMAASCGMLGQPCCSGTMCTGASTCQGGTCGPPQTRTISSLRQGGVAQMTPVAIAGAVVTFVKTSGATSHGFFVQDPAAPSYGGIYVYAGSAMPTVNPGDIVTATGLFQTYRDIDELDVRTGSYQVVGNGAVPAAVLTNISTLATDTRFQSMLVYVTGTLHATTATDATGTFTLSDGVAQMSVSSYAANDIGPSPFPATVGQAYARVSGLGYAAGPNGGPYALGVAPRSAGDLQ
jgi:hypothetical protein